MSQKQRVKFAYPYNRTDQSFKFSASKGSLTRFIPRDPSASSNQSKMRISLKHLSKREKMKALECMMPQTQVAYLKYSAKSSKTGSSMVKPSLVNIDFARSTETSSFRNNQLYNVPQPKRLPGFSKMAKKGKIKNLKSQTSTNFFNAKKAAANPFFMKKVLTCQKGAQDTPENSINLKFENSMKSAGSALSLYRAVSRHKNGTAKPRKAPSGRLFRSLPRRLDTSEAEVLVEEQAEKRAKKNAKLIYDQIMDNYEESFKKILSVNKHLQEEFEDHIKQIKHYRVEFKRIKKEKRRIEEALEEKRRVLSEVISGFQMKKDRDLLHTGRTMRSASRLDRLETRGSNNRVIFNFSEIFDFWRFLSLLGCF